MNDKIKIMHTADLHLGAELSFLEGTKRSERKAELMLSAERLFKTCEKNRVDLILLAGDIFDTNAVDESIVSSFFNCIGKINNIPVVLAAGNHDPLTSDSPFLKYIIPRNLFILGAECECIRFEKLNTMVYGRSFKSHFMNGSESFGILPDNNSINIMVMHGDLSTDISGNYNSITKGFISNSGMDYFALGHIHSFSGIQKAGKTTYAYSGCPEPHGFDELGEKGVIFGEISKSGCNLRFISSALRNHETLTVDISTAKNSSESAETILKELKKSYGTTYDKNLYKIILTGRVSETVSIDTADIARRLCDDVFYIKVVDKTEIDLEPELVARESTLKGIFVKKMLQKIESQGDPSGELTKAMFLGIKAFTSEVKFNEDLQY